MATLQQTISEQFLNKLAEAENISPEKINQLRALLGQNKRPKPEDFVKIFSLSSGDLQ
jgi:hypothetical protein